MNLLFVLVPLPKGLKNIIGTRQGGTDMKDNVYIFMRVYEFVCGQEMGWVALCHQPAVVSISSRSKSCASFRMVSESSSVFLDANNDL